ncbi:2-amino-4-hydroxy-6-hydroxymethyldihydropteridine pyrophosphokinase [Cellvibrio zantedeschiae]|uniref:2-amino-4-hydroxy-6-hydroxymethyldihydropteridine pyrophosphokinase n=1 Tax=Cellvibrio zantedeschiae TaxID=1237077 RepID=A0ABQ3B648_9GAMM|nr:2-amino-4-hydroxy-6-hydroxymethyldihydropteridine diphosphokinase [Cellvibrio zantedeschiae]GGY80048.1 2-amino-4-hydroxy-6-hydroxymethyldihydropteridine pyrophosphokinase [Cellvibrio zantedeschiae]
MLAYIGLGSNLDNPRAQVEQAFAELAALSGCELLARSPLYGSTAIGPGEQPDYVNAVGLLKTELTPLALLDALQAIEQSHRRVRLEHWGPRTLDLDILLLDNLSIDSERLKVPHPYLTQRSFVLYPLADIAPALHLPDGRSLQEVVALCPRDGLAQIE